jgi:hypothetical protein
VSVLDSDIAAIGIAFFMCLFVRGRAARRSAPVEKASILLSSDLRCVCELRFVATVTAMRHLSIVDLFLVPDGCRRGSRLDNTVLSVEFVTLRLLTCADLLKFPEFFVDEVTPIALHRSGVGISDLSPWNFRKVLPITGESEISRDFAGIRYPYAIRRAYEMTNASILLFERRIPSFHLRNVVSKIISTRTRP